MSVPLENIGSFHLQFPNYLFDPPVSDLFFTPQAKVADEKRVVEEQRRVLDDEIADFQRRKAQYETDKMSHGHHTLGTLGKLGKKK